jgi:two-component system response regulator TtrR
VCIVDGDPAVRDSLATVLDLCGLPVRTFATGQEFLEELNGRPIRCVICEAELPDLSGVEVYRLFKERHPGTRFALLMSRTDPTATALAQRSGIDTVFHKPLVHRRLTRFVTSD